MRAQRLAERRRLGGAERRLTYEGEVEGDGGEGLAEEGELLHSAVHAVADPALGLIALDAHFRDDLIVAPNVSEAQLGSSKETKVLAEGDTNMAC